MKRIILIAGIVIIASCSLQKPQTLPVSAHTPDTYWQQHLTYIMDITVNVDQYTYEGKQKIIYTNHSPDTLREIYYHLYYNAFQPGSAMDKRLQSIADPDSRMVNDLGRNHKPRYQSRIALLKPDETGYIHPHFFKQNGHDIPYHIDGTLMKVSLRYPLLPGDSTVLETEYSAQIPVMIRRTGRNSKGGIALSMAQWYPKPAVYDRYGWHNDPYIAREFYGEWADFDVRIHIDKNYTVGATGYLQNPQQTGHGYENPGKTLEIPPSERIAWHFIAPRVHDFVWMADDNVLHDTDTLANGTVLHFIYKNTEKNRKMWKKMQPVAAKTMQFYNRLIGAYPCRQYSILQGGDGGMEYPMATLISAKNNLNGLNGTMMHEMAHEWFYYLLANNESQYPWMDEGFASFAEYIASSVITGNKPDFIFETAYKYYTYSALSGQEESMTTHSDKYRTNMAYSINAYDKGLIFLSQLGYITGFDTLLEILKTYYRRWKFKHPYPGDFMKIAEEISGMHLGWYYREFVETVHFTDYGITSVKGDEVRLVRKGMTPMPLEIAVQYTDGSKEMFYIPQPQTGKNKNMEATILPAWNPAQQNYTFKTGKTIGKLVIDPSGLMADIDRKDNAYGYPE